MIKVNIRLYLEEKQIFFDSTSKMISWVKRNFEINKNNVIKIGPNYLIDKKELEIALRLYMTKQENIKQERIKAAKKMTLARKRKLKKIIKSEDNND